MKWLLIVMILMWAGIGVSCKKSEPKENSSYLEDVVVKVPSETRLFKLKQDIKTIRNAITVFSTTNGRNPESMQELEEKGVLAHIPAEALGGEWNYDPETGEVTSSTHPEL